MTATASAALIADLDKAVNGRSPQRRAEILRKVAKLFVSDAERFNEAQIDVFDDVLVRLIERVEAKVLAQLSGNLAAIGSAPKAAVRQLAFHEDASVAAPVLRNSKQLSEQDLISVAHVCGQQHLLAISGRETLNESLSDVLVKRGDSAVRNTLVQNAGARLSEIGYAVLVRDAERDDALAEKLGLRQDISPDVFRELVGKAAKKVRARLLDSASPEMQAQIRATTKTATEKAVAKPKPIDYGEPRSRMIELNRTGKLNDTTLNRFAVERDYISIVAALSFLSEVPIEAIEPLITSERLDGLIVACKAARLNWSTTTMIIRNRHGCAPVSKQQFEQGREVFDGLSLSAAQRTIKFWSTQSPAERDPIALAG
jgi:uncharacterized protein (DUF2336 family)